MRFQTSTLKRNYNKIAFDKDGKYNWERYTVLKEFDLQTQQQDKIMYHSLYRGEESGEIEIISTNSLNDVSPNAIDEAFGFKNS